MSIQLTVTLPDRVYERIKRLAELTGRDVQDTLAETLDGLLPPLSSEMDTRPIEKLTDSELIRVSEQMMDEMQSARMSALLYKQQAEPITEAERAELQMLMDVYETGQIRKAKALAEAVKRGLRQPLES
ncbi:MAG: hypothetical protein K8L97_01455 [Anaerolineae bacterium]|nr:hypothetical protein [Anaerolineae bacterium]